MTSSAHAVGFVRDGTVATVVTRLAHRLEQTGGWGGATVVLPPGRWRDLLSSARFDGGEVRVDGLLDRLPVAFLVRQ